MVRRQPFRASYPEVRVFSLYRAPSRLKCTRCNITYKIKHTCPGRAHRKRDPAGKLDDDSQHLTLVISFLDGANITDKLLDRASAKKRIWGSNGEIQLQEPSVIPVLSDRSRTETALLRLEQASVIAKSGLSSYSIVKKSRTKDIDTWKFEALRVVLHTFPEHRQLDPLYYTSLVEAIIPQLQHVLPYLDEETVCNKLDSFHVARIVNMLLSASYFLEVDWKKKVLDTASRLLKPQDQSLARIKLRRVALSRICNKATPEQQINQLGELSSEFRPVDKRSNADLGEILLLQARVLVDLQRHRHAFSVLEAFMPWDSEEISTLEQIVMNDITLIRGEILRYEGNFREARDRFMQLLGQVPTPPKVTTQLGAVSCELGNFDPVIETLTNELKALEMAGSIMDSRNAKRLQLGLADAHLFKAIRLDSIHGLGSELREITESIKQARRILESLEEKFKNTDKLRKVGKINRFRILAALAILEHLQGSPILALARWDEAQAASRDCGWSEGYSDMIVMYSKCELMCRLGNTHESEYLLQKALQLYQTTGRQYHFTGLGSVWPDYVSNVMRFRHGSRALD
ncbi:hypothetical protein K469DRAFT_266925 [Zopfia rhizophila CBS 207.26]|uniref:TPR-like protein n=1 Tax=Zopfia rhizophila CBS 207.26 TaxID=1314779 RepID=A0A6A6DPH9_9PEZI|nr:hypothetical protein K469DRAFT_266925 [Zopfia rhizophila CBS 207.26]